MKITPKTSKLELVPAQMLGKSNKPQASHRIEKLLSSRGLVYNQAFCLARTFSLILALACGLMPGIAYAKLALPGKGKKIVVFTDYEADDSVAIGLLLQYLQEHNVHGSDDFMIGTLLSNQYRKKALAQTLVKLFGYPDTPIYAGTGGIKEPFEEEGCSILPQKQLEKFLLLDQSYLESNNPEAHQDNESILQFKKILEDAAPNSIDVVLLTNPIDFVKGLDKNPDALHKIKSISMMGGWFAHKPSFNWSMYLESVIELFDLMDKVKGHPYCPTFTIFSSHFFAREFNGYVNHAKFPQVIEAFDTNSHPIVTHLRHMVQNWDASMTEIKAHHDEDQRAWRLEMVDRIGKDNIGRQFAPADPVTMVGYLYQDEFILKKTPCNIQLTDSTDSNGKQNAFVTCKADPTSNIFVVEKVDIPLFNDKLLALMAMPVEQEICTS